MADTKTTALTELTSGNIADADLVPIVDVSDTTMAATGTVKKTLWSSIRAQLKSYTDTLYSALGHTHAASDITSGTVATARLGSGTANSTTYLRGDQTWATVSGGSPAGSGTEIQYRNGSSFGASGVTWNATVGVFAIGGSTSSDPGWRKGSATRTLEAVDATAGNWCNIKTDASFITNGYYVCGTAGAMRGGVSMTGLAAMSADGATIAGWQGTEFRITESTGSWTTAARWHSPGTSVKGAQLNDGSTGGAFIELLEMTAPGAPGANKGRLYLEDNGSGKTRLMVLFPSGAAQQIAIEP